MRCGGSGCELEPRTALGLPSPGRPSTELESSLPSAAHSCVSMGHSQGVRHLAVEPQGLKNPRVAPQLIWRSNWHLRVRARVRVCGTISGCWYPSLKEFCGFS